MSATEKKDKAESDAMALDNDEVEEEEAYKSQMMDLAQWVFTALNDPRATPPAKEKALAEVRKAILELNNIGLYEYCVAHSSGPKLDISEAQVKAMKEANTTRLDELDKKFKDAEENLGESEIQDALLAKADFLASIGEKDKAISQYRLTEEKTMGVGPKLDIVLSVLRLALFWDDNTLTKAQIAKAKELLDQGGDWERRNRLKVYEAVFLMRLRQFKRASELLQESVATFTCTEMMPYTKFIFYTVVLSLVSCDRPTLKQKVVNAPEILQVIREMPHLQKLMNSLYNCRYREFFEALVAASGDLSGDRYLSPHYTHYVREMRIVAYSQYLISYRSVSLESMASTFGLTVEFLDLELARFIAANRLPCRIDRIAGLVESQRPDSRNHMYQKIIKQGDGLLNRVQKLSRVINV